MHYRALMVLAGLAAACIFSSPSSSQEESPPPDAADELVALRTPANWSSAVHMMIHIGPYTIDLTGDFTVQGELVKARLLSGVGSKMIYVKVYTGADGIQWTELSEPPRKKEVVKLDLKQVAEALDGKLALDLLEEVDGSSALGVDMANVWRPLLDEFGEDATVTRTTVDGEDVFQVNLIFTERTYYLIDPSGELREEEVKPTVMILQVSPEDGLLRYMALLTTEPAFNFEMIFKDFVINPGVDPASFEYTPPDNVEPEDITPKVIAEITGVPLEEEVEDFRLIY